MADEALAATPEEECETSCCGGEVMSKVKDAKEKVTQAIDDINTKVKEGSQVAQAKVKESVEQTEECIKVHPWAAVGIAASVGLVAGVLVGALACRRD